MTAAADTIRDALQRYASMPIGHAGLTDINVSLAALARLEAVAETAEALIEDIDRWIQATNLPPGWGTDSVHALRAALAAAGSAAQGNSAASPGAAP